MSFNIPRPISIDSPDIAVSRRPLASILMAVVRNPLSAIPPQVFHEPLVLARLLGRTRIYLADPALIHDALVVNADCLAKGDEAQRALGPALGQGLLTANGQHWRWQRQAVAPGFQHEKLLGLLPAMIAAAERRRDLWLDGDRRVIDIGHEMMQTTFDIIVETMMSGATGMDVSRVERGISDYLKVTGWIFALALVKAPTWFPYPGRRRARRAAAYLRSAITAMVATRRQPSRVDSQDLVALLLAASDPETGRKMSDPEITDNLLTFITAGHETTALGLAWAFHLLAKHPLHEAKVAAEIEAVTEGGPLRPEHIAKLVYTRQAFSEAMRLYPPAPIIARKAIRDFQLGPHLIPAGTQLYVPIYAVHHHTKIWTDPERFDPERFSPDQIKARHRYAYMPFGAGPRVCIGSAFAMMEAVAILAVLLKAVRLRNSSSETQIPTMKVTLRPQHPLWMQISAVH